jgi:hypothetical protein
MVICAAFQRDDLIDFGGAMVLSWRTMRQMLKPSSFGNIVSKIIRSGGLGPRICAQPSSPSWTTWVA